MIRAKRALLLAPMIAVLACLQPALAAPQTLLQRMADLNPHLHSYTASIHADVQLHAFVSLSPSLDGTYYHKEPDKNKVIFTSGLPAIAAQFGKVYPEIESPSRWDGVYRVSTLGNDGTYTRLRLVPRKHGRIGRIDVTVNDATATIAFMRWIYNDGGYAELHQTYSKIDGNLLVTGQSGSVETPQYSAQMRSTYSNFDLNVYIPDKVFEPNS